MFPFNALPEFETLRSEIDRMFDDVLHLRTERPSFFSRRAAGLVPPVNIGEDADNVYLEALVPGVDPEKLNISVNAGEICIEGERPEIVIDPESETFHRHERTGGKFFRALSLPDSVDPDRVTAEYRNGILAISLGKKEEARPRQIEVKVA